MVGSNSRLFLGFEGISTVFYSEDANWHIAYSAHVFSFVLILTSIHYT